MDKLNEFRSSSLMYDIFGYFLPGFFFICIIIIDFDFGSILKFYFEHNHSLVGLKHGDITYKMEYLFKFLTWNTDSEFKFTTVIMLILFCYLLGHIIAAISSLVLESWINNRLLGFPSENLLSKKERTGIQKLFNNYTKPFSDKYIEKFEKLFKKRFGKVDEKKSYFWLCFGEIATNNPVAYNRVIHFLSLYGFSRNVSACFLIYSFARLFLSCFTHLHLSGYNFLIIIIFILIGLMMFKNYLKLYYRQCMELYHHFYVLQTMNKQ